MSSYIGKVQIGPSDQEQILIGSTLYGTCSTPATTADKVVTLPDFDTLMKGITVHIRFINGNSVTSNVTLTVGNTTEYPVVGNCVCNTNDIIPFTYYEDSTKHTWYANTNIVVAEGTTNGTIKVNGQDATVHGLDTAAYTPITNYATAAQGALAENAMPKSGGAFTGPVTLNGAPTSDLEAATKAYVDSEINNALTGSANAMIFKGTLGASTTTPVPTITSVPTNSYSIGDTYRIVTAGTYAGVKCEIGDLIIAIHEGPATGTTVIDNDWTVAQGNLDGTVTGVPADSSLDGKVALFDGTSGDKIKASPYTLGASVPFGAVFTDTTYSLTDGEAYTEYTLINSSSSPIADSVNSNGASILASVNQGVLTLAAGIQFITGDVGASLSPAT